MTKLREYAIKIVGPDRDIFRFATKRFSIADIDGDNTEYDYLPLIVNIDEPRTDISLEGAPSIPSYSVEIFDESRKVIDNFKKDNYQSSVCEVKALEDGEIVASFQGFLTDVSSSSNSLQFKIRLKEDSYKNEFLSRFVENSFQQREVRNPKDVDLSMAVNRHGDTPWRVADAKKRILLKGYSRIATVASQKLDTNNYDEDARAVHTAHYSASQRSLRYYRYNWNSGSDRVDLVDSGSSESTDVGQNPSITLHDSGSDDIYDEPAIVYEVPSENSIRFAMYSNRPDIKDWVVEHVASQVNNREPIDPDENYNELQSDFNQIFGLKAYPQVVYNESSGMFHVVWVSDSIIYHARASRGDILISGGDWTIEQVVAEQVNFGFDSANIRANAHSPDNNWDYIENIYNMELVTDSSGNNYGDIFIAFKVYSPKETTFRVWRWDDSDSMWEQDYINSDQAVVRDEKYRNNDVYYSADLSYQSKNSNDNERLNIVFTGISGDVQFVAMEPDSNDNFANKAEGEENIDYLSTKPYSVDLETVEKDPDSDNSTAQRVVLLNNFEHITDEQYDYRNILSIHHKNVGDSSWTRNSEDVENKKTNLRPYFNRSALQAVYGGSFGKVVNVNHRGYGGPLTFYEGHEADNNTSWDIDTGSGEKHVSSPGTIPAVSRKAAKILDVDEVTASESGDISAVSETKIALSISENSYFDFKWDNGEEQLVGIEKQLFADPDDSDNINEGYALIGSPGSDIYNIIEYKSIKLSYVRVFRGVDTDGDRVGVVLRMAVQASYNISEQENKELSRDSLTSFLKEKDYYSDDKEILIRPLNPGEPETTPGNEDNKDKVYVKHNGFYPYNGESDPNLVTGFFDIGEKVDKSKYTNESTFQRIQTGGEKDVHKIYRFSLKNDFELLNSDKTVDSGITGLIGLEVHNHNYDLFDTDTSDLGALDISQYNNHDKRVEIPFGQMDMNNPRELEIGEPVMFVEINWIIKKIQLYINNLVGDGYVFEGGDDKDKISKNIKDKFQNRYKGTRIVVLQSSSDIRIQRKAVDQSDEGFSEFNKSLINQATEKYGIPIRSEIKYDNDSCEWYEELKFSLPKEFSTPFEALEVEDAKDNKNKSQVQSIDKNDNNELKYDNFLRFDREWKNANNQNNKLGKGNARDFFMGSLYRAIKKMVPRNSDDLGKMFPLAYGKMEKVPLLYVIGKSVSEGKPFTAGDDVYIYAAHPCAVEGPFDISIFLDEQESGKPDRDESDYNPNIKEDVVESPFPNVKKGHFKEVEGAGHEKVATAPEPLYHPYHKLVNNGEGILTNFDRRVFGVRLRGKEWNHKMGALDKRYPVRFGLGSTKLFGSFLGMVDRAGKYTSKDQIIKHPLDIIRNYIVNFGEKPFVESLIDQESLDKVKSKTPKYKASAYITENINPSALISNICKQFGILWYFYNGKIKFEIPDLENPDLSSPISDKLNIANKIEESVEGYQSLVTKILFKYEKNFRQDKFEKNIVLDRSNNKYCRKAAKAKGQTKEKTISANYIRNPYIASDVASRMAKWLASRKIFYTFTVKRTNDIIFEPSDVVPLTYAEYGIKSEPVLVKSVKPGRTDMQIEVIRFPDIFDMEPNNREIKESSPEDCTNSDYTSV